MNIKLFLAWYDFWVGWYFDRKSTLYICLIPCVVIMVSWDARRQLKRIVKEKIETEFPGSKVICRSDSYYECWFDALMISDDDFDKFEDFTWALYQLFEDDGCEVHVDAFSPEDTMTYRKDDYNAIK
jgi:hypothetical protein